MSRRRNSHQCSLRFKKGFYQNLTPSGCSWNGFASVSHSTFHRIVKIKWYFFSLVKRNQWFFVSGSFTGKNKTKTQHGEFQLETFLKFDKPDLLKQLIPTTGLIVCCRSVPFQRWLVNKAALDLQQRTRFKQGIVLTWVGGRVEWKNLCCSVAVRMWWLIIADKYVNYYRIKAVEFYIISCATMHLISHS